MTNDLRYPLVKRTIVITLVALTLLSTSTAAWQPPSWIRPPAWLSRSNLQRNTKNRAHDQLKQLIPTFKQILHKLEKLIQLREASQSRQTLAVWLAEQIIQSDVRFRLIAMIYPQLQPNLEIYIYHGLEHGKHVKTTLLNSYHQTMQQLLPPDTCMTPILSPFHCLWTSKL
jgi:hypothetical protein